jgi:predicted small lipoprotein YifL
MPSPGRGDLLWCRRIWELAVVSDSFRLRRLALIGMVAAAFALAGCGRKGPLEVPPSATAEERAAAGDPAVAPPPVMDEQGRPIAPESARKKKIFLDWLLD